MKSKSTLPNTLLAALRGTMSYEFACTRRQQMSGNWLGADGGGVKPFGVLPAK